MTAATTRARPDADTLASDPRPSYLPLELVARVVVPARVVVHRSRARALAHDARKADASSAMDARVRRRVGV